MTARFAGRADEFQHPFSRARAQLVEARRKQAERDTPANRAAVAGCLTLMEALLDMYLETGPLTRESAKSSRERECGQGQQQYSNMPSPRPQPEP
jgi:hypothetical protein